MYRFIVTVFTTWLLLVSCSSFRDELPAASVPLSTAQLPTPSRLTPTHASPIVRIPLPTPDFLQDTTSEAATTIIAQQRTTLESIRATHTNIALEETQHTLLTSTPALVATNTPVLPTALPVALATDAPGIVDKSIRTTDWQPIILKDPYIENWQYSRDRILYSDLDGDQQEEAVLPIHSGGTAGFIAMEVYRHASPQPQLVSRIEGYKMQAWIQGSYLLTSNAFYAGWEPNCCPSGRIVRAYALIYGRLQQVAEWTEGFAEEQATTVQMYYAYLQQQQYGAAYKLLAPSYQQKYPLLVWLTEQQSVQYKAVNILPSPTDYAPTQVDVTISRLSSIEIASQERLRVTWTLTWQADAEGGWRLSDPLIVKRKPYSPSDLPQ